MQGRTKPVLEEKTPHVGWAIPSRDGKRLAVLEAAATRTYGCWKDFKRCDAGAVSGALRERKCFCARDSLAFGDIVEPVWFQIL